MGPEFTIAKWYLAWRPGTCKTAIGNTGNGDGPEIHHIKSSAGLGYSCVIYLCRKTSIFLRWSLLKNLTKMGEFTARCCQSQSQCSYLHGEVPSHKLEISFLLLCLLEAPTIMWFYDSVILWFCLSLWLVCSGRRHERICWKYSSTILNWEEISSPLKAEKSWWIRGLENHQPHEVYSAPMTAKS